MGAQTQANAKTKQAQEAANPVSRQQETLMRWLDRNRAAQAIPAGKVKSVREAFAEQGLELLPDPLLRFRVNKVVRVVDLL